VLHQPARRRGSDRPRAQHDDGRLPVEPLPAEREQRLVRLPPHDERVDRGEKLLEPVRLGVPGQKVELPVRARDEPVEARPDKDRCSHPDKSNKGSMRRAAAIAEAKPCRIRYFEKERTNDW
jgi:hypothetical protein